VARAPAPGRGVRVGTGGGYSDLEFALLSESGSIDARTVVVTTVHPVQVLDEETAAAIPVLAGRV
jgi:5-formyltetrahydrofolate cyclo-ligase